MPSQYTRGRGVFTCLTCGKQTETRYASQAKTRKYCSDECARTAPGPHGRRPVDPDVRFAQYVDRDGPTPDWHPEYGHCWIWTGTLDDPDPAKAYGIFTVDGHQIQAHRRMLEQTLGRPLAAGELALHTCDNGLCVRNDDIGVYEVASTQYQRFGHLWLGDNSANTADRHQKQRDASGIRSGRFTKPERTANGVMTPDAIIEIFQRYWRGETQHALAHEFGTSQPNIHKIVNRRAWKHITESLTDDQ